MRPIIFACIFLFCCGTLSGFEERRVRRLDDTSIYASPELPLDVCYSESAGRIIPGIRKGVDYWNNEVSGCSGLVFRYRGECSGLDPKRGVIRFFVGGIQDYESTYEDRYKITEYVEIKVIGNEIIHGDITISSELMVFPQTARVSIKHALGHFLGLRDDIGPPQTVDLRSIMASPLDLRGKLTKGDREALCTAFSRK